MIEQARGAHNWAKQWFLRTAGAFSNKEEVWTEIESFGKKVAAAQVVHFTSAPYLHNQKIAQASVRAKDGGEQFSLQHTVLLGAFDDGAYSGRLFFQKPTSQTTQGASFTNIDDSNYAVVRHVLEWQLELKDGLPSDIQKVRDYEDGGRVVPRFANQLRMAKPSWDKGVPGTKKHGVGLLWRDVLVNNGKAFVRYDLLKTLQTADLAATGKTMSHEESFERLPAKLLRR